MKFYRYVAVETAAHDADGELVASKFPNPHIYVHEYVLVKETPKGYWISPESLKSEHYKKLHTWIAKSSKKRYAYPTKEEAMLNFIKRTEQRIEILKRQEWSCSMALDDAKSMFTKLTEDNGNIKD